MRGHCTLTLKDTIKDENGNDKVREREVTLRLQANEIAEIETMNSREVAMPVGLRAILDRDNWGMKLARHFLYVGLMHAKMDKWNPLAAGQVIQKHVDCGGSFIDIIVPAIPAITEQFLGGKTFAQALAEQDENADDPLAEVAREYTPPFDEEQEASGIPSTGTTSETAA